MTTKNKNIKIQRNWIKSEVKTRDPPPSPPGSQHSAELHQGQLALEQLGVALCCQGPVETVEQHSSGWEKCGLVVGPGAATHVFVLVGCGVACTMRMRADC